MKHATASTPRIAGHPPPQSPANPRRPPPHLSKSLPPSKKQKLENQSEEQPARQAQVVQAGVDLPTEQTQSSGSGESASRWFDKANLNVPTGQDTSHNPNDDAPFFLNSRLNRPPKNLASSVSEDLFGAQNTRNSENEDLRDVIDDLTVENKRLKTMLRGHRPPTSESGSLPPDRLFELRVHGLSAEKKRELEGLLRNFTAQANNPSLSISKSTTTDGSRAAAPPSADSSLRKSPSQGAVKFHHADSGYASNSQSGVTSAAISGEGKSGASISRSNRDKTIKNYLHDIPDSLLPHPPPFMSERAKQVLVVRRLEQLFTGKTAAPGEHSQPVQQQEVSHSAAKAEAHPGVAKKTEGSREAHVLHPDTKVNLDSVERPHPSPERNVKTSSGGSDDSTSPTRTGSPDQRPTRPLDLDIQRAQVASENIEYIRHLGLSTPYMQTGPDLKDDSWIYLNLLIGMSQLHTLNVTPNFVRRAIRRCSTKFDLSEDGKCVRWKGGSEGTAFSIAEEQAIEALDQSSIDAMGNKSGGSSRRSKTNSSSNAMLSEEPSEDKTSGLRASDVTKPTNATSATSNLQASSFKAGTKTSSAFDYKPLVYKGKKHSAAASYLYSTSTSSPSSESGDLAQMMSNSNLDHKQDWQDGMITFYNNPYFCSDISADKSPINWKAHRLLMPWEGLGTGKPDYDESPLRHHDACYFTPQFAPKAYDGSFDPTAFSWQMESISVSGEEETQPMELEASGIGGVWPEDNFAVDVKVMRRGQDPRRDQSASVILLTGSRKRKRYGYTLAQAQRLDLQPSRLPPPSHVFFTSSSSSANPGMEDSDSDTSSSADDECPAPAALLHHWSSGTSDVRMADDDSDSDSVDMLELVRAAAPDQVAAQEREYVLTRPGGVAVSLAATVGASRSSSDGGSSG